MRTTDYGHPRKSPSLPKIKSLSQITFCLPHRPKFLDFFDLCLNWVSIYSWSIGHILEHEFFCLGCLGWAGSKEKKWIWVFLCNFWGCFFQLFEGKKIWSFFFFFWKHCTSCIVESIHIFFGNFDDFAYCWTFEILHLHICLLLNLWTFFTAEPLRLSVAAEPLDFLYCWTFGFSLLLNL